MEWPSINVILFKSQKLLDFEGYSKLPLLVRDGIKYGLGLTLNHLL